MHRLAICLLLPLLGPATAEAGWDWKQYTGVTCQSSSAQLGKSDGWAFNTSSSSTLTVDCPATRDQSSSSRLWVHAIDRNYTADVRCYAASLTLGSGTTPWQGWWTGIRSTSGTSNNLQELDLGVISGNSMSTLYITCDVPPTYAGNRSGIFGYATVEF